MAVDQGHKNFEKFRYGGNWYIMYSKDFNSKFFCKFENKDNEVKSSSGQRFTFRLSTTEV